MNGISLQGVRKLLEAKSLAWHVAIKALLNLCKNILLLYNKVSKKESEDKPEDDLEREVTSIRDKLSKSKKDEKSTKGEKHKEKKKKSEEVMIMIIINRCVIIMKHILRYLTIICNQIQVICPKDLALHLRCDGPDC